MGINGVTCDNAIVLECDAFPLTLRNGGCFLDADTPKALVSGGCCDGFLKTASQACTAQTARAAPYSPTVFSPSKSFSEAISATASHSLRNYFSLDSRQFCDTRGPTDHYAADEPQVTAAYELKTTYGHRSIFRRPLTSGPSAATASARSHLLFGALPPIKTFKFTASPGASLVRLATDSQQQANFSCSVSPSRGTTKHPKQLPWADAPWNPPASGDMVEKQDQGSASDSELATSSVDRDHLATVVAAAAAEAPAGTMNQAVSGESGSVATAGRKRQLPSDESETSMGTAAEGLAAASEAQGELLEEFEPMRKEQQQQQELQLPKGGSSKKKDAPVFKTRRLMCRNCSTVQTPQWREGPEGARTLCNACGLRYRKGLPLPYWDS